MEPGYLRAWKGTALAVIVLVLVGIAFSYVLQRPMPEFDRSGEVTILVSEFGAHFKDVPLTAEAPVLNLAIEEAYRAYAAPELIQKWETNPSSAPGRETSSPWPEALSVISVTRTDGGGYLVKGDVLEKTSTGDAGSYPVTLLVEDRDGTLMVIEYMRGEHGEEVQVVEPSVTSSIAVTGTQICLAHKDTSGPQTMECAIGLQGDDGSAYALDTNALGNDAMTQLVGDSRLRVTGTFVPAEALSSDAWQKYSMRGIIHVTKLEQVP